ncbi:FAD-dependent oxidoreductase [Streptomyces sp. F63]|uniref:FAD-dependent oxidoreductase n=1 Tax=Streptomyces sp. F63 TaxID=2824887 RepID=UPI001B38A5C8|nr:FAD-dependent oxidoreductase [Streptomyces sp. F63]MBQ0987749.1 FAD-dependent oxidoreductase [Streptomyces sp. F63]
MTSYQEPDRDPGRRRIVVIGGGMAGARLVQQLTALGGGAPAGGADVTVIGEEPHGPYNRVLLADVLAGRYGPEVIALPVPAPGASVRHLTGVRAVRIDRDARLVLCDDGRRVPYDALVLATGSNPVLPPLRGLFEPDGGELPSGVHPFRTLDDCRELAEAARPGVRAVVIGGGLLGVSAARALARRGAQVVLAQQGEHLMERQLDADASGMLRRHLEALGVEVHTECRVRGLRTRSVTRDGGSSAREVTAVELADGFRLDAEIVVLACGVRPRTGLALAAGLTVARGIVVDDELRTGDPRIHAIGDCAEHGGTVYGLAGAAQEQADVLARVLTGATAGGPAPRYRGTRALTRLSLPAWPGPSPAGDGGNGAAATGRTARVREAAAGTDSGSGTAAGPVAALPPVPAPAADGKASASRPDSRRPEPRAVPAGAATPAAVAAAAAAAPGTTASGPRPGSSGAPAGPAAASGAAPEAGLAPEAGAGAGAGAAAGPLDLAAFGETTPAPGDDVIHLSDATRGAYRKVVVRGDRLVGGILLGDLGTVGALARTWEGDEPLPSAPLLHLLTHDGGC